MSSSKREDGEEAYDWYSRIVRLPSEDDFEDCFIGSCVLKGQKMFVALVATENESAFHVSVHRLIGAERIDATPIMYMPTEQFLLLLYTGKFEQLNANGFVSLTLCIDYAV